MLGEERLDHVGASAPEGVGRVDVGGGVHVGRDLLDPPPKLSIAVDLFGREAACIEVVADHHDPRQQRVSLVLHVVHAVASLPFRC